MEDDQQFIVSTVLLLVRTVQVTEQFVPELHGRLGVAPLPGATSVLDRGTWRMAPCTNDTCPYATPARDLFTGNTVLINRAPYFGFGGFAGQQNSGARVYASQMRLWGMLPHGPRRELGFVAACLSSALGPREELGFVGACLPPAFAHNTGR